MNFDLTPDQELFEQVVLRFFEREFPLAAVRKVFDSETGESSELWHALSDLGVFGLVVPEEFGGAGREFLDLAVVAECLGYSAAPGPFLEHVLATLAIIKAGSEKQQAQWLPDLASGSMRASCVFVDDDLCHLEGGEGTFSTPTLTMRTDSWALYPERADLVVVVGAQGIVVVPGADNRLELEDLEAIDRTRRLSSLRCVGAPVDPLTGAGTSAAELIRQAGSTLLAADAVGGARRCVKMAVDYANSREQFGVPIGQFQAVKHQIADMATAVEPMRALVWYAAHSVDHVPDAASKFSSLAKAHVAERFLEAARTTVEIFGGIGYTWECDVQFFLKRAIFDRVYLGTPQAHRARVAAINGW